MVLHKLAVPPQFSVRALGQSIAECCLAGDFGSNYKCQLGQHCSAREVPDLESVTASVDLPNFAKLLVHFDDGLGLLLVGLKSGLDNFLGVVRAAASLGPIEAALYANFEGSVEVEDRLALANDLFEVNGLVFGPGEAVNEVVLSVTRLTYF
jgi:hypothetical protein